MAGVATFRGGPADGEHWAVPDAKPPPVLKFPIMDEVPDWACMDTKPKATVQFGYVTYTRDSVINWESVGGESFQWRAVYHHADD